MKINRVSIFTIVILLVFSANSFSRTSKSDYAEPIYRISNDLFYHYGDALGQLDSLVAEMSPRHIKENKPYLQYAEAIKFYLVGNYNNALENLDSALMVFIYQKEEEWQARALLQIGYVAECLRLNDNALEFYSLSLEHSRENRTLGLAYLGLARSLKRTRESWGMEYDKGNKYLADTNNEVLKLYKENLLYWFYPDTSTIVDGLKDLTQKYSELELYTHAAICQKFLSRYYLDRKDFDLATEMIDSSIVNANRISPISKKSLAGIYFTRGEVMQANNILDEAESSYMKSIQIFEELGSEHSTYTIYRTLFRQDTLQGNLESAIVHNDKALACYRLNTMLKETSNESLVNILRRRELISEELDRYSRNIRVVSMLGILLIIFFLYFTSKLKKRRVEAEKNYLLIKETVGDSLINVRKHKMADHLSSSQNEIERRIDRHLTKDKDSTQYIKDNLALMILQVECKLPQLRESEIKCASLIALGCSLKDIEDLLCVKYDTVKTYRSRIRKSLGITDSKANLKQELLQMLSE